MRKVMWVLLGLVLLAGAASLGTYRHWWEPQQRAKGGHSTSGATSGAATRSIDPRSAQAPATRSPQGTPSTPTTAFSFDTVVNVLNIVVGVLGIWMTWIGMRMQRQAMQITSNRERR